MPAEDGSNVQPQTTLPPPAGQATAIYGSASALHAQLQIPPQRLPPPGGQGQGAPVATPKASLAAHLAKANDSRPPLFRLHPDLTDNEEASSGVFGSIRFADVSGDPAKFVRLPYNRDQPTSPADVLDLMSETWGLDLPDALISIVDATPAGVGGPRSKELPKGVRWTASAMPRCSAASPRPSSARPWAAP